MSHLFIYICVFRLSMNMKDAHTGRLIWTAGTWDAHSMFENEIKGEYNTLLYANFIGFIP